MSNNNFTITRIVKELNDSVSFYADTILQANFSQVKKTPEREFNGQRIIVTGIDERQFYFDCWSILDVDGRTYAPIDISLANANDLYEQRLNDILIVLTLYVFKGCCETNVTVNNNISNSETPYTTNLPNALTATYTASAHGVALVTNVTVLNTSNNEVEVVVNINQTNQDVMVSSNINLQNHTILIS